MPIPLSTQTLLLLLALQLFSAFDAAAQYPLDQRASRQAQIEAARRKTMPPPERGARDAQWHELIPGDWDPTRILRDIRAAHPAQDGHDHASSHADPEHATRDAEIQSAWDNAPTVSTPDEVPIRLTGFAVIPGQGDTLAKTVILMPFYGVGLKRPPPPANQMVIVTFKQGLPRNLEQEPLWVTGRIYPLATPSIYGRVGYMMPDARWQKFPLGRYPLPRYQALR